MLLLRSNTIKGTYRKGDFGVYKNNPVASDHHLRGLGNRDQSWSASMIQRPVGAPGPSR